LEDGATLAQFKRSGDDHLIFLVTPRVIINSEEEVAATEAELQQATSSTADKAPKKKEN
jgi:hypothetical protein